MKKEEEKNKIAYLLIKIDPGNADDVYIMLTLFKVLWEGQQDRGNIKTISSIYGPYDTLIEMEGDEKVLEQTAFSIREALGMHIADTLTLLKLEYTVEAGKLKKRFEDAKLMIPEDLEDLDKKEIKLVEFERIIREDKTLSDKLLNSLTSRAKPMNLRLRIDDLTERIKKLEEGS